MSPINHLIQLGHPKAKERGRYRYYQSMRDVIQISIKVSPIIIVISGLGPPVFAPGIPSATTMYLGTSSKRGETQSAVQKKREKKQSCRVFATPLRNKDSPLKEEGYFFHESVCSESLNQCSLPDQQSLVHRF